MAIGNLVVLVITLGCGSLMIGTLYLEDWLQNEHEMGFLAGVTTHTHSAFVAIFKQLFCVFSLLLIQINATMSFYLFVLIGVYWFND